MKRNFIFSAVAIISVFLSVGQAWAETFCEEKPKVRPLECVCGRLTDETGEPLPRIIVKILRNGATVVAQVKSDADGNFKFGSIRSGNYELTSQPEGFLPFRSPIVIARPSKRCAYELTILFYVSAFENCGSQITNP